MKKSLFMSIIGYRTDSRLLTLMSDDYIALRYRKPSKTKGKEYNREQDMFRRVNASVIVDIFNPIALN